jgi:hypothetical protein
MTQIVTRTEPGSNNPNCLPRLLSVTYVITNIGKDNLSSYLIKKNPNRPLKTMAGRHSQPDA